MVEVEDCLSDRTCFHNIWKVVITCLWWWMITAKKTFSSKSQVININSINLFLLIPYHFQISLSSPTATSRLHKLVNFLGSARRINRLLLVTTNRQKTGPQKKMAATMKCAGKATIDCHFRLRLAGSFFPAQPCVRALNWRRGSLRSSIIPILTPLRTSRWYLPTR